MRNGKYILYLALVAFGTVFVGPIWNWYVSKRMDTEFPKAPDIFSFFGTAVGMFAPYQHILLGISVGMMLALAIGYWGTVKRRSRRAGVWTSEILSLMARSAGGKDVVPRKIISGGAWLEANEHSTYVHLAAIVDHLTAQVKWWPTDDFYCHLIRADTISISRLKPLGTRDKVAFEIWGRTLFWKTIKHWRETDYIGQLIAFEDAARKQTEQKPP